ncbi:MAG: hypothetical protein ACJ77K_05230 [Bacteroidia bacterium]
MKLENRKQRVVPFRRFLLRMAKFGSFALGLIFISVLIGMLGYHSFAGLGWLDSFHMACLILTGMGPVSEMTSRSAKIFDSVYALYSGVAFLSFVAVIFAPVIHRLLHILHVDDKD